MRHTSFAFALQHFLFLLLDGITTAVSTATVTKFIWMMHAATFLGIAADAFRVAWLVAHLGSCIRTVVPFKKVSSDRVLPDSTGAQHSAHADTDSGVLNDFDLSSWRRVSLFECCV